MASGAAWLRANGSGDGGDPARVVVTGNSAGAAHVAGYVAGHGGGSLDGVRGAALLSGIYEAGAARPGIARALILFNPDPRARLRQGGFLTPDPRAKERKKFGLKAARRAPQWSKR